MTSEGQFLETKTYQVSVNEIRALQVGHSFAYIYTHAQQSLLWNATFSGAQEFCQTAVLQKFKHQVYGGLLGAHTVQPHQLWVGYLPVVQEVILIVKRIRSKVQWKSMQVLINLPHGTSFWMY